MEEFHKGKYFYYLIVKVLSMKEMEHTLSYVRNYKLSKKRMSGLKDILFAFIFRLLK